MRQYQVTLYEDGSVTVQDELGPIFSSFREWEPEKQTLSAYIREQAAQATSTLFARIASDTGTQFPI